MWDTKCLLGEVGGRGLVLARVWVWVLDRDGIPSVGRMAAVVVVTLCDRPNKDLFDNGG